MLCERTTDNLMQHSLYMIQLWTIGVVVRMPILDTKVAGLNLSINMFSPWARDFIRIASVDSAVKWVPGGDNLVKGVQCYELFGGIALKNHTSFFIFNPSTINQVSWVIALLLSFELYYGWHILY